MRVWSSVIVNIGNNFSTSFKQASIARHAEARLRRPYDPESGSLCNFTRQPISGSIVNDDHFEVRIFKLLQACQSVLQCTAPVVGAYHYRDHRPCFAHWEGNLVIGAVDARE